MHVPICTIVTMLLIATLASSPHTAPRDGGGCIREAPTALAHEVGANNMYIFSSNTIRRRQHCTTLAVQIANKEGTLAATKACNRTSHPILLQVSIIRSLLI